MKSKFCLHATLTHPTPPTLPPFLSQVMDLANDVRKTMVEKMREKFADLDLTFSIGGQISFDLFPKGWDKTYCLRYVSRHSLPPSLPPSLSFSLLSFLPSRICG